MDNADKQLLHEVNDKLFYKKSIGPKSAKRLVEIIATLELDREMWAANADSAALLAARQVARIAELEDRAARLEVMFAQAQRIAMGMSGELNSLKRRLWEVENFTALADPHLFEKLADENKNGQAS